MFARVSTYQTNPESIDAPSDDVVRRVLEIPGCLGIYYLNGKDTDRALSIVLWDTEAALTASQEMGNQIRTETSKAQNTQILDVEEYEVTTNSLRP